ncbi:hypothetical protein EMIHUDRAFT_370894, partial [Emiliania huxleyi CCMP1516]|uniref:Uncharacterized protein n=2 Tax=Emiliania huxleyi TaxID=2903 RepID=A0A0D3ISJ5_EMIH1
MDVHIYHHVARAAPELWASEFASDLRQMATAARASEGIAPAPPSRRRRRRPVARRGVHARARRRRRRRRGALSAPACHNAVRSPISSCCSTHAGRQLRSPPPARRRWRTGTPSASWGSRRGDIGARRRHWRRRIGAGGCTVLPQGRVSALRRGRRGLPRPESWQPQTTAVQAEAWGRG